MAEPQDSCYLWNKLGSDAEVDTSEIGVNGARSGTVLYAPGKFDNGQFNFTVANYITFTNAFTSPNLGIIDFWWKPGFDQTSAATAGIIDLYDGTYQWNFYWQGGGAPFFQVVIYFGVNKLVFKWTATTFAANTNHHIALCFDASQGAGGGRFGFYLNESLQTPTIITDTVWAFPTIDFALKQVQGPSNAVVDNLKVYNQASIIADVLANKDNEGWPSAVTSKPRIRVN